MSCLMPCFFLQYLSVFLFWLSNFVQWVMNTFSVDVQKAAFLALCLLPSAILITFSILLLTTICSILLLLAIVHGFAMHWLQSSPAGCALWSSPSTHGTWRPPISLFLKLSHSCLFVFVLDVCAMVATGFIQLLFCNVKLLDLNSYCSELDPQLKLPEQLKIKLQLSKDVKWVEDGIVSF